MMIRKLLKHILAYMVLFGVEAICLVSFMIGFDALFSLGLHKVSIAGVLAASGMILIYKFILELAPVVFIGMLIIKKCKSDFHAFIFSRLIVVLFAEVLLVILAIESSPKFDSFTSMAILYIPTTIFILLVFRKIIIRCLSR